MLADDTLLNIFRHYLEVIPRDWPTLAWVCRAWRQIIFTSPLSLNLRLYCTYRTPVLKTLHCWPDLPIIVQYGGRPNLGPPAPEDDENIIAALTQSGRVSSIGLTVSCSLLEKLSAISEPFSELEELALMFRDNTPLTLPSTFRWGPRLRTLHLTRIAFPSFLQLLSPCHGLVDLQLHEIPSAGYFSPEGFTNALSGMTQLETLSLHFLSLPPRRNYLGLPPHSWERVLLPSLTCLKYRGTSKYLDSLVARVDAPRLGYIDLTFFSQPTMDASQLGRFIERIELQRSFSQADVQTSADAISISFTNSSIPTALRLQIPCKQLDWQLSSMSQILNQFSHFLFRVENLGIDSTEPPSEQDDEGGEQWPELIREFGSAKDFRLSGVYVTDILCALRPADEGHPTDTTVLPSLRNLRVKDPFPTVGRLWDAAQSFITSRRLSGRPVRLDTVLIYQCHICDASFTQQQEYKRHLGDKHAEFRLCSYCGDYGFTPEHSHLFPEHLSSKHPEVVRNDALSSDSFLAPTDSQLVILIFQHSSLLASDIVSPSSTVTARYSR